MRRAPWKIVPRIYREIIVRSRPYYLLSIWLRKNPPNKKSFTIKQVADELGISRIGAQAALSKYREHSKIFVKYVPFPKPLTRGVQQWSHALDRLHSYGFFMVNPREYHSKHWVEPTFRQFEDYNARYFGEAIHRGKYRLQDAVAFSLAIDGLDVRKELAATYRKQTMLESF